MRSRLTVLCISLLLLVGCKDRATLPAVVSTQVASTIRLGVTPPATATLRPTATAWLTATQAPTATAASTPGVQTGQHPYVVEFPEVIGKIQQTIDLRFMLYLPADYGLDAARRWPVILYLHGSGESGPDLSLLLRQPLPELLDADPDFPFIVISPQLTGPGSTNYDISGNPQDYMQAWGWNGWYTRLNMLLDYVQVKYAVDTERVYLTGISLGGFGAWNYALRFPERFAAVVPIAGGYHYGNRDVPENICDLAGMGVWAFHGDEDSTVSPFQSEVMIDALKPCGGEAHLTMYPGVAHEAWQLAYRDEALWQWLLDHTLEP